MKRIKEKRGITLIALAVTIIVILILAGVTIDAIFSENGIINKAKEAANAMNNAIANDQAELNDLLEELNEIMNSEWESNIEIPDPEPEKPPKLEDTTGIQDETIQVEDEYGNKVTIPKGFEVVEEEGTTVPEGIVIQDKDGNQFVWIPVGRVYKDSTGTNYSDIQLGRYTFNTTNGTPTLVQAAYTEANSRNYDQLIGISGYQGGICYEYTARANPDGIALEKGGVNAIAKDLAGFVESVKENYGYYLARYEPSYGSGSSVTDYKPLSKVSTSTTFSTSTVGSLWNNVTQIDAAKIARNMYNSDSTVGVESDLVNSYAWDTAIVYIQEMGYDNYSNRGDGGGNLKNTGTSEDKACNIYDMASNSYELSTEYSSYMYNSVNYPCVIRGGQFTNSISCPGFRMGTRAIGDIYSFRVLLYIK